MFTPKAARFAPLVVGGALLIGLTIAISAFFPRLRGEGALVGTDLKEQPAPDFRLTNAEGQSVSLTGLRGKAVALTFIYTSCPDVCPLTTQKFQQVYNQLGPDVARVALVAVTVDPETDTPRRLSAYSQAMGMTGKWDFLTGTRPELEPIWSAYYVGPLSAQQAGLLVQHGGQVAANDPSFQGAHSFVVYVIDPLGRERRLLDTDFSSSDLLGDLRELVAST